MAARLRDLTRDLTGSILVAEEGINGVLAASAAALDAFERALLNDPVFENRFAGIGFKRSGCKTAPFRRIKVHRKKEIVALGVAGGAAGGKGAGIDVSPADWRRLIAAEPTWC